MKYLQREIIKERVTLPDLTESKWKEENSEAIEAFCANERLLVVYDDQIHGLVTANAIPKYSVNEMFFFIKTKKDIELTPDNFNKIVQYGMTGEEHVPALLRLMIGVYAPIFFENKSWPDSIKNDFTAQLHKFLASLTDTRWRMEGKTVLYIPHEGVARETDEAFKDKDLVQRLESKLRFKTKKKRLTFEFHLQPR